MNKPIDRLAGLTDDDFAQRVGQAVHALPDVPQALQRAAIGLWSGAAATGAGLTGIARGLLRQVHAVLTFDSWGTPALAGGMRSLRSATRHLLFSAEGRDVDLRISPVAEVYALAGQILGPDDTGRVQVRCLGDAADTSRSAELDELGEFRIEGLHRGVYVLTLQMGSEQIVLPPVEVGEAGGEPVR